MKLSAGIVLYRKQGAEVEVLLGHRGGPFYQHNPLAWDIFKGEVEPNEDPLDAAIRECREESSIEVAPEHCVDLGMAKGAGKQVIAWACLYSKEPPRDFESSTFELEWPPKSGQKHSFPEVNELKFFPLKEAKELIPAYLVLLLEKLERIAG